MIIKKNWCLFVQVFRTWQLKYSSVKELQQPDQYQFQVQQLVGTQIPTWVTTQSKTISSQSQTPPALNNTTSTSSSTEGSSRTGTSGSSSTGASGSSSTGASGSSNTTVGSQPTRTKFDPLGINFENPRFPTYAVLTVRINTYNGWPTYLDQTAMAMAGFFYAGRMFKHFF